MNASQDGKISVTILVQDYGNSGYGLINFLFGMYKGKVTEETPLGL